MEYELYLNKIALKKKQPEAVYERKQQTAKEISPQAL